MVALCSVCKQRTTGRGTVDEALECVGCKTTTHKKCCKLSESAVLSIVEGRSSYRCASCRATRRSLSISEDAPNIIKVSKSIEDLSNYVHEKWASMEKILLRLEELSKENVALRQKLVELEERGVRRDEKVAELEAHLSDFGAKNERLNSRIGQLEEITDGIVLQHDKLLQRENQLSLEIVNVPQNLDTSSPSAAAVEIFCSAIDVTVDSAEILGAKLIAVGPDKKRLLEVKVSSMDVTGLVAIGGCFIVGRMVGPLGSLKPVGFLLMKKLRRAEEHY